MIRVFIADDRPISREGLKQIISKDPDIILGGEVGNAQEVMECIKGLDECVLLLDLNIPGNGIEILRAIKQRYPNIFVVVLCGDSEDHIATHLFRAGASGIVYRHAEPTELLAAIRKVHRGELYVSSPVGEKLAAMLRTNDEELPHAHLSSREYEVFCMIAEARSVEEIAERLFISIKTVRTYRGRVLKKLNLKNDVDLVRYAIQREVIALTSLSRQKSKSQKMKPPIK